MAENEEKTAVMESFEWELASATVSAEVEPQPILDREPADDVLEDPELLREIAAIPDRMAFKIGEVANMLGVKPYVLRYWESEFDDLRPKKSNQNQRMYSRNDVKTVLMIRKLLYKDRFSIEGARKALRRLRSEVKKETSRRNLTERYDNAIDKMHALVAHIRELRGLFL